MTDFFSIPVGDEQEPPLERCPYCQRDVPVENIRQHLEGQHTKDLHWSQIPTQCSRIVAIVIGGGVAYVQHCPDDVEIYIRDLDNEAQAESFDDFGYKEQLC